MYYGCVLDSESNNPIIIQYYDYPDWSYNSSGYKFDNSVYYHTQSGLHSLYESLGLFPRSHLDGPLGSTN